MMKSRWMTNSMLLITKPKRRKLDKFWELPWRFFRRTRDSRFEMENFLRRRGEWKAFAISDLWTSSPRPLAVIINLMRTAKRLWKKILRHSQWSMVDARWFLPAWFVIPTPASCTPSYYPLYDPLSDPLYVQFTLTALCDHFTVKFHSDQFQNLIPRRITASARIVSTWDDNSIKE